MPTHTATRANTTLFALYAIRYDHGMFHSLSLRDSFEYVATEEDWAEFAAFGEVDPNDLWIAGFNASNYQHLTRYADLWLQFAAATKLKLLSGEWTAEGFVEGSGGEPQSINRNFWRSLEFQDFRDRAVYGKTEFFNLSITCRTTASTTHGGQDHAATATFRRRLATWIETEVPILSPAIRKDEICQLARAAFPEETITDNLFRDAWKSAEIPADRRKKGRPKI